VSRLAACSTGWMPTLALCAPPARRLRERRRCRRRAAGYVGSDPLLLALLVSALGLAGLVLGLGLVWGAGPVLAEIPWSVALVSAFNALTTLCVAYLALGRCRVLHDPLSYWAGIGFAVYGIGQVFFALSWPGVLPAQRSILAELPSTSALVVLIDNSLLGGLLLAALLGFGLLIGFESVLPELVSQGRFGGALRAWAASSALLFALGAICSVRHYRRTGDRLAAYIAFPQLASSFIALMVLIGDKRDDLWWYVQRVILAGSFVVLLFGLLSEPL